jgi:acyl-CoA hydrolase
MGAGGLMSGPGGASDFARGAYGAGGLGIVALPASAGKDAISRIVGPGAGAGPVSLGRMDTDIVVRSSAPLISAASATTTARGR